MHILNYRRILGELFRCFLLSELRDAHSKHVVYEGYERDIAVASYQPEYWIQSTPYNMVEKQKSRRAEEQKSRRAEKQ